MSDIGITELLQQADRLRSERSGRAPAIHHDWSGSIRDQLTGARADIRDWKIDGAIDVSGRVRFR